MKIDLCLTFGTLLILVTSFLLASNLLLAPILHFIRILFGRSKAKKIGTVTSISVIVPAYNEERNIAKKIDSLWHALQRIGVDAEVIIGSDGSTDRTLEIAAAHLQRLNASNWRLLEFENEGKCRTINKLVREAKGEIIVSTDADISVPENALELVIDAFRSYENLGCVSSVPMFNSEKNGSQRSYWSLEEKIREAESSLGRLIVVTGWLFAFKKSEFEEIPAGVMADDLWIPLTILLKGFACIQIDQLRVLSEVTDEATEIKRRKRVISGGMDVVRRLWPRIARDPAILFLVLAHKVNRWALPLWLFLFIGATIAILPFVFIVYALTMGLAIWYLGRNRFLTLAYAGISPVISFAEVMRKKDFARWEHTRKH